MERNSGMRPSLDFRMIFAFNLIVYFDFFKHLGTTPCLLAGKKKKERNESTDWIPITFKF